MSVSSVANTAWAQVVINAARRPLHGPIPNVIVINYGTEKYDFRAWACQMLNFDYLEKLHERAELDTCTDAD